MFNSYWISSPKVIYSSDALYAFKKSFELSEVLDYAEMNISAQARYKLFINGKRVTFGPCRSSGEEIYYDTFDVKDYLVAGQNEIYAEVLQLADNNDMTKQSKVFGVRRTGNMLLAAELTAGDCRVITDNSWNVAKLEGESFEIRDGGVVSCWLEQAHKDISPVWESAVVVCDVQTEREEPYVWGIVNPLFLTKRPIPMLYQKNVNFARNEHGYYIADELTFGLPRFIFEGKGKAVVTYAEAFGDMGGKGDRLDESRGFSGASDIIEVNGRTVFEPFWYRTARIVKIEIEGDVSLEEFTFTEVGYPLTYPKDWNMGNEADNKLYKISVATLSRCMQETYEDCPYYEQLQYDMDSSLQMLYNYQLTDDDRLARKCIHDFRLSRHQNGLLNSRYPTVECQYIPSFCFYYIFMVAQHYKRFGDVSIITENIETIEGILNYFRAHTDTRTGLIHRTMYWDFIDWAVTWNRQRGECYIGDDPANNRIVTILSAMFVYFLKTTGKLCLEIGESDKASKLFVEAFELSEKIEKYAYNEEKEMYSDDLRGEYYSQHMQLWCVLADIATGEKAYRIMKNSLELETKCTFAYAYFYFRALEKVGLYAESERMMSRLRALPELNLTTIPETPDAPRSDCHAWGAIAIYEFAQVILGVKTDAPDNAILIAPYTVGREKACGTVHTYAGDIFVSWSKADGFIRLTVKAKHTIDAEIRLGGKKFYILDRKKYSVVVKDN